jgi:superfamily II DNA or RNA helicase
VLIFTHDNATAYHIGERFSLPVLTHQTKVKERRDMLGFFREGRWPWLVTSRVLNEGVDVPEVDIGIIVSGSGSVREHVQRLGRLLRKGKRERAKLVELISSGTGEEGRGRRRREHEAYR